MAVSYCELSPPVCYCISFIICSYCVNFAVCLLKLWLHVYSVSYNGVKIISTRLSNICPGGGGLVTWVCSWGTPFDRTTCWLLDQFILKLMKLLDSGVLHKFQNVITNYAECAIKFTIIRNLSNTNTFDLFIHDFVIICDYCTSEICQKYLRFVLF